MRIRHAVRMNFLNVSDTRDFLSKQNNDEPRK